MVTLHIRERADLHDVAEQNFGQDNAFRHVSWISRATLVIEVHLAGSRCVRQFPVTFSEPHRCSLQSQRDERLRRAGEAVLTALGVLKPVRAVRPSQAMNVLRAAIRLVERNSQSVDGVALQGAELDVDALLDAGLLIEGDHLDHVTVEVADGDTRSVPLKATTDPEVWCWEDPGTGETQKLPVRFAHRYRIDRGWLREWLTDAVAANPQVPGGDHGNDEPAFLGELRNRRQSRAA